MAAVAQRLSRNTLTLLISNGGGALLSFVLSVLIGRVLGETGLGIYTTALAWVFPLWMVAEFGLETLITREVAANHASGADYLRVAVQARILLGGGLMLLLLLVAPLLSSDTQLVWGLQISAPLIVIGPLVSTFSAIFRAHRVMWPVALLNVGMLVVQLPLTALVFLHGGGVLAALTVNVMTSAAQLIAAWGIYKVRFTEKFNIKPHQTRYFNPTPNPSPPAGRGFFQRSSGDRSLASLTGKGEWEDSGRRLEYQSVPLPIGSVLRQAWPFAIAAVLSALQLRMSVILLEQLAGTAVTGQYAAASRFVEAGRMLPNALFGALFPALSMLNTNQEAFNRLFRRVASGLAAYGLLVGIGAWLFAPLLIDLTYGEQFGESGTILRVLAWVLLPGLLKSSRILMYYAQRREGYVNRVTLVALLVQFILSVILIPTNGAIGAAMTLILVEALMLVLLWR